MKQALSQFQKNLEFVRQLGHIYHVLENQTTSVLDLSDMLRAQIVLLCSALDHYIHELTRLGMLEIASKNRSSTPNYERFKISLSSLNTATSASSVGFVWLEDEIREQHSYRTFQQPDKIAEAIRLISNIDLWRQVAIHLSMSDQDIKNQLKIIIEKRNRIAHEADTDPYGSRWPIGKADVDDAINFIETIANAIFAVI